MSYSLRPAADEVQAVLATLEDLTSLMATAPGSSSSPSTGTT